MTTKTTRGRSPLVLRTADAADAPALHALIAGCREEGHLLPRSLDELSRHATRFVVAVRGKRVIGCGDLAGLSRRVAEVRSLAVAPRERRQHVGQMIVDHLRQRAADQGFEKLCAFTHAPGYFIQMGFSIVPHLWLLEKVTTDCVKCPLFNQCGQYAMVLPLGPSRERAAERTKSIPLVHVSSPASRDVHEDAAVGARGL